MILVVSRRVIGYGELSHDGVNTSDIKPLHYQYPCDLCRIGPAVIRFDQPIEIRLVVCTHAHVKAVVLSCEVWRRESDIHYHFAGGKGFKFQLNPKLICGLCNWDTVFILSLFLYFIYIIIKTLNKLCYANLVS